MVKVIASCVSAALLAGGMTFAVMRVQVEASCPSVEAPPVLLTPGPSVPSTGYKHF